MPTKKLTEFTTDESVSDESDPSDDQSPTTPKTTNPVPNRVDTPNTLTDLHESPPSILEAWDLSYMNPKYNFDQTSQDEDEHVTITRDDLYSADIQTHDYYNVTGVRITLSNHKADKFKTEFTPRVNGVNHTTHRVVHYCSLSEAFYWATQLVTLAEDSPDRWIFVAPNNLQMLRFLKADGSESYYIYQQDRDMFCDRLYNLYQEVQSATKRTQEQIVTDIPTRELATTILTEIAES